MSEEPKKWKRGDIGPDGRVFWGYSKTSKGGIMWLSLDKFQEKQERVSESGRLYREANKERVIERDRLYREANKDRVNESGRLYREANKERISERKRLYCEANKERENERKRLYCEANKERVNERKRLYYEANKEMENERGRLYYEANKERVLEMDRRKGISTSFKKYNCESLDSWLDSLRRPDQTLAAIFSLTPDPGQTLAELIHDLSGYPMELCEQIANPPMPDEEPEPESIPEILENPKPTEMKPPLPDLF